MKTIFLLLIVFLPLSSIARTYSCTVQIDEMATGNPLKGILVVFYSKKERHEAKTDSNGRVVFNELSARSATIEVSDPEGVFKSISKTVLKKDIADELVTLEITSTFARKPLSYYYERNKMYPNADDDSSYALISAKCENKEFVDPAFPGGTQAMMRFVRAYTEYPEQARELGEQGRVYISFIIEKDGTITHVDVARPLSKTLDLEAKWIVYSMPTWTPAMLCGEPIRSRCRLPITFTLQE